MHAYTADTLSQSSNTHAKPCAGIRRGRRDPPFVRKERNAIGEERKAFGSTLVTMVTQQGALATSVYVPDVSSSCDKRFNTRRDRVRIGARTAALKFTPRSTHDRPSRKDIIWSTIFLGNTMYYCCMRNLAFHKKEKKDTISMEHKICQLCFVEVSKSCKLKLIYVYNFMKTHNNVLLTIIITRWIFFRNFLRYMTGAVCDLLLSIR